MRVDVEPGTFDAVSKIFGQTIADTVFTSFTTLRDGLSGSGGMAGTDPGGTNWGSEYDKAVVEITGVTQDVINGVYRLAALLEMTGFNHGQANSASTPGGTVQTTDTMSYNHEVSLPTPPPASGGSGSTPDGWSLISDLVGYVWPNGDQDKLRAAGSAWSYAAQSVTVAGYEVPPAVAEVSMQTSPEVADATQACNDMGTHLSELSTAYTSMSTACNDYAQHLDDAHSQVINELVSLLEWTAGLEIAGGLLGLITAGGAEVPANAALAARCAFVASRVGGILGRLIELAGEVAQAIVNALARVIEISQKLKALLGAKLSQATAAVVARLPGAAKTAGDIAFDQLSAWTKDWSTRGLEIEEQLGGNLPRSFPTIDKFDNGVATSIKSIDLTSPTYQNVSALGSKLRGYVDKVAGFKGAAFSGKIIRARDVTQRVLQVAIQPGVESPAQRAFLDQLDQYATSKGVKLIISEVP